MNDHVHVLAGTVVTAAAVCARIAIYQFAGSARTWLWASLCLVILFGMLVVTPPRED